MIVPFVVFLFISCCNTTQEISYDSSEIDSSSIINVEIDTVPLTQQLVNPRRIEQLNDSLLVIFDPDGGDNSCMLLNSDGFVYDTFGRRGKAKNELISPISMTVCGNKVIVYDYSTQKAVSYYPLKNVHKVNGTAEENYYSIFPNSEDNDGAAINSFIGVNDGRLFIFGNNKHWISMLKDGNVISKYMDYPIIDSDEECNWSLWGQFAEYAISPNNKHLIVGTRIGAVMELFHINDKSIEPHKVKGFYRPDFNIAIGAIPKCVTSTDKTIEGFCSICALDDYFLAVIGGKECMKRNEVIIFDYEGKVLGKRLLPGDVSCMAVINNSLYMIIDFLDGKTKLCKADITCFE